MFDLPVGTVFRIEGKKVVVKEDKDCVSCSDCVFNSLESNPLAWVCKLGIFGCVYVYFMEVKEENNDES